MVADRRDARPVLLSDDLKRDLERVRDRWNIPGISLSVVARVEGVWSSETFCMGIAAPDGTPVDEHTGFSIASNSKLFTALAAGLLIHRGTRLADGSLLDWSTKIRNILPYWQLQDPAATDEANVIDLMNMRTGLPSHDYSHEAIRPDAWVKNLQNLRPSAPFRGAFQYNNAHYATLSEIVRALTGTSFVDFVQENILDPLGMSETFYDAHKAEQLGKRSHAFFRTAHNPSKGKTRWKETGKVDPRLFHGQAVSIGWWTDGDCIREAGPGALIMSGKDMRTWLRELLDPKVIPRELLEKTRVPLSTFMASQHPDVSDIEYGLAQMIRTYRGHSLVGHNGGLPGQYSTLSILPERELAIMLTLNDEAYGAWIKDVLGFRILDDLLGLSPIDWESFMMEKRINDEETGHGTESAPAAPEHQDLTGNYDAAGYGQLSLKACRSDHVVHDILMLRSGVTMYLAETGKLFATHLAFVPCGGTRFKWHAISIYKAHDAARSDGHVGRVDASGEAILVPDEGIGMFGNYWLAGPTVGGRQITDSRIPESCEVWYELQS